jgi:type VI secretion system Hcp family effector
MNRSLVAYMHVKGSSQGGFLDDHSRAGKGKTSCLAVRFRGEVPHDVRKGEHAVTKHEPIRVTHEWSPATAQFLNAMWSNEILDEVKLEFVRQDKSGKEEVYATLTLSKATVACMDLHSGKEEEPEQGEYRPVSDVGLVAEKIEFKLKDTSGQVTATYDRKKS